MPYQTIFHSKWLSAQASTRVLLLSASLHVLLNRFKVDTKAFFVPSEAGRAFLPVAAVFDYKTACSLLVLQN